jgi:hypothetical protein
MNLSCQKQCYLAHVILVTYGHVVIGSISNENCAVARLAFPPKAGLACIIDITTVIRTGHLCNPVVLHNPNLSNIQNNAIRIFPILDSNHDKIFTSSSLIIAPPFLLHYVCPFT